MKIIIVAWAIIVFGWMFVNVAQAQYYPYTVEPYHQHNYNNLEQQRELQQEFLRGQRENMLIERDLRQWDYEKRQRELEEKYY